MTVTPEALERAKKKFCPKELEGENIKKDVRGLPNLTTAESIASIRVLDEFRRKSGPRSTWRW